MQLRVYRQYHWENVSQTFGGPPQWSLKSTDILQYLDQEGQWTDIPVVEGDIPSNPDQEKLVNEIELFLTDLQELGLP